MITWTRKIVSTFPPLLLLLACMYPPLFGASPVILLVADDGGYAEFGFQQPFVSKAIEFKTPHLDALAGESIVFPQGYVSGTVCSPTRAGLISGRYQQRLGYEYNISNDNVSGDGMPTWVPILPEQFQAGDFFTGCIGKWHLGSASDKQPQNRGFDFFFGLWSGSRAYFQDASMETNREKRIKRNTTNISWWSEASFNGNVLDSAGKGRHLTDAFGDEMARFVRDHAADPDGFFLYVPFTSPHGPYGLAKQQDMNAFNATSFSNQQKKSAALIFALDRAVGHLVARLKDPNLDGNTADSIYDETAIVFYVDNGGASTSTYVHDNTPLRGHKSSTWEGGIRVPFFMKLPGFAPGTYSQPVTSLDATATLLALSSLPPLPSQDGVDLRPYLSGANTNSPHEHLYWRQGEKWAIRQGDWKLTRGNVSADIELYQLGSTGTGELADLSSAEPGKRDALEKAFTAWDLRNAKPRWSSSNSPQNVVDRFQFRPQDSLPNWSANQVWSKPDDSWKRTQLSREDAFADCVLQFPARDDLDYTSNNNLTRQTGLHFALNKLRIVATAIGAVNHTGTITGNPLLFTRNLADSAPHIENASTVSGGMDFTLFIDNQLLLYDDLELSGDGDTTCHIRGDIQAYGPGRGLNKTGSATVRLSGVNRLGGAVNIHDGVLELAGGILDTTGLSMASGQQFVFSGGRLETPQVNGNLSNPGGTLAVEATLISGDYTQFSGGRMEVEIDTHRFDHLEITGQLSLDGTLDLVLLNGQQPGAGQRYPLMQAGALAGTFAATNLPSLGTNLSWVVDYSNHGVELRVASPGDRDGDGLDDAWEQTYWASLSFTNAGNQDSDTDGFNDLQEFIAGTNPTDDSSFLSLTRIAFLANGVFGLHWSSVSGKVYTVYQSTDLLLPNWQVLQGNLTATGSVHYLETNDPGKHTRFRVGVE
jgi:autotransporter-associated beta strand protein